MEMHLSTGFKLVARGACRVRKWVIFLGIKSRYVDWGEGVSMQAVVNRTSEGTASELE